MNVRKNLGIRLAARVLMLALAVAVTAAADTHYVSPGQSIQAAIDDANDGDEIQVAPGIYNEAIIFKGKAVRLYSSGGPDVTIIDGTGNYHVVQCISGEDANTVLEGFTITGGNAIGDGSGYPYNHTYLGGGMYNLNSSPTVKDCNFSTNFVAADGGGMYNNNSSPTVTNCTFSGNSATNWSGGGMYNMNNSNPTVTNCTFSSNSANYVGGGMCNNASSPTVTNCTLSGNLAANWGGGMCNWESSNPTVTNCTLSGNIATNSGGGIMNNLNSKPTFINCILWGNSPDQIDDYDYPSSSATVAYSDVQGGWGGTGNIDADPCFVDAAGGNLRLSSSISPCVDAGDNSAPGLPATDLEGNPRVADGDGNGTAIVDMGAFEFYGVLNITQGLKYIKIQPAIDDANDGDEIQVAPGTYNEAIDFKGKAVRLYSSGGPDVTIIDGTGNYHVVQCVSGEDANTVLEGFTITGGNANGIDPNDRRGGGMFNFNSSPMVTNCTFTNLRAYDGGAMYNLNSSPTVTNCNFSGNLATYSGGGMYNYNASSPTVADCTFSQNTAGTGGGMVNVDGSNPEVTNCAFSDNASSSPTWGGAGMCNLVNCSPRVINCTFSGNTATYDGGGMSNYENSSPTVTNCILSGNSAVSKGGGMYNNVSSPTVKDCTFSDNTADNHAGGMYNNNSNPTVTSCIFTGNTSSAGGGMFNGGGSSPAMTNCIFSGNSAGYGAGMWNYGSSPTVTNCTFSSNAGSIGGGMYNEAGSNSTVTNCIFWGNTLNEIMNSASSPTITYSDVQGGYTGKGNIDTDPFFVDANNPNPNLRNLQLKPDSPCIDAGDTTAVPGGTWADIGGNPRVLDDTQIPDTGVSLSGLTVDMGAYEFYCSGIHGDINCDGVVDFRDVAILCNNWLAGAEPE